MTDTTRREGTGIHSGAPCAATVERGPPGSGVVFLVDDRRIPASVPRLVDGPGRCTALGADGRMVHTVEHLLAAAVALGYRDLIVRVEGPELPALDGSAEPWVRSLARLAPPGPPRAVRLGRQVAVERDGGRAVLTPLDDGAEPVFRATIEFDSPALGRQTIAFRPWRDDFAQTLSAARTFALLADVERLRRDGLARGGSLDNALVIGHDGPINPDGLRFRDEPVRHKLLDALGDLSLLGGLPWAAVDLTRPGHRLLREVVRDAWPLLENTAGAPGPAR